MGDRFMVIITWIVILAFGLALLRYGRVTVDLARVFFGWLFATTQTLSGLAPSGATVPNAPTYNISTGP